MVQQLESSNQIRIPLYAQADNKINNARAGFVDSYGGHDQHLVNMFPVPVKDPLRPDSTQWSLVSRTGLNNVLAGTWSTALAAPTTTQVVAACSFARLAGKVVVCYKNAANNDLSFYEMDTGTGNYTLIGNSAVAPNLGKLLAGTTYGANSNVWLSEISVNETAYLGIVIDNGTTSWGAYVASSGGSFGGQNIVEITDTDFAPKQPTPKRIVGPMVWMNNYVFVVDTDGFVWNSDSDSITSWNSLNFIESSSIPDKAVRLVRYKHHLVVFSASSIEFLNDEGNTTSPLQRTNQAYVNFGAMNTNAIISVDDTLFWIARSVDGTVGLWRMEGYTPTKVTGPYDSSFLRNGFTSCNLQIVTMSGLRHLITNIIVDSTAGYIPAASDYYAPSNSVLQGVLCYCIDTGAWWVLAHEDLTNVGEEILVVNDVYRNIQLLWNSSPYGLSAHSLAYSSDLLDSSTGYDKFRVNVSSSYSYFRIPHAVFTTAYDFGTSNKKTIYKMSMVGDVIFNNGLSDFGDPFYEQNPPIAVPNSREDMEIFLCYTHNEFAGLNPIEWKIREFVYEFPDELAATEAVSGDAYPITSLRRLRINNLGYGRWWKFAFFGNFWVPVRLDALELDVRRGVH